MEEGKKVANLDSVLENLGPYGKYNVLNFALLLFPILLSAFYECGFIFEAQQQSYRCEIDGCEHINDTSWINFTIPLDSKGKRDTCNRYLPIDEDHPQCVPENFSTNKTLPCQNYVYEIDGSFVQEFDLGCQDWRQTLVGLVHNGGMFVAMLFTGAISDRFGRRVTLGVASIGSFIFGLTRAFATDYYAYLTLHFLEASIGAALYPSAYVFIVELVGKKQRVFLSAMCNMTFVIGEIMLALLAWFVHNWRTYVIILYTPAIIVGIYVWFMNESARWLLSKGRRDDAIATINKAAKINKLDPKMLDTDALCDPLLKPDSQKNNKTSQLTLALRSSIIWKRVLICSFLWMTCSFVYYGLTINAVSLSGNRYVSFMLVTLVEIPAYVMVVIILDKYGRKKTLICTYVTSAATSFLFAFLPPSEYWSVGLYLIGKWSVTLAYSSVYIYVSEVFPTNMRQTLISVCSTSGKIGSMVAPVTPLLTKIHTSMPTVIFGGMCLVSSLLVFLLPETRNMRLPDTIQEAEELSKMQSRRDISQNGT